MKRTVVISSGLVGVALLGAFVSSQRERVSPHLEVRAQAVQPTLPAATLTTLARAGLSAPATPPRLPVPPALPTSVAGESAFMADLRVLSEMDPELAIERASEGSARYGSSADASERRSILIHALARVGRAAEARGEAERMVNECPDDAWVSEIERFTGAHRHRNIRLAASGQLEYE